MVRLPKLRSSPPAHDAPWRRRFILGWALASTIACVAGGYTLDRYTQSNAFCGETCHRAMAPQQITHRVGAHASVQCTACHVGRGVGAHLRAKWRGVEHLATFARGDFEAPIRIRDARYRVDSDRCIGCHSLAKLPASARLLTRRYRYDAANTALALSLTLHFAASQHVDRVNAGIGWHMREQGRVEFRAADATSRAIPWVRVRKSDGTEVTYRAPSSLSDASIEALERRTMECSDCHNRTAHAFASPDESLDRAFSQGRLSPDVSAAKRRLVEILTGPDGSGYDDEVRLVSAMTQGTALDSRAEWPQEERGRAEDLVVRTHRAAIFRSLNTKWTTYDNHLGHRYSPGCFRCHDGQHVSDSGAVLPSDCATTCHSQPQLDLIDATNAPTGARVWHPWQLPIVDLHIPGHDRLICSDCHASGFAPKMACESCHHPPGI